MGPRDGARCPRSYSRQEYRRSNIGSFFFFFIAHTSTPVIIKSINRTLFYRCRSVLRRHQRHDGPHARSLLEILLAFCRTSVLGCKYPSIHIYIYIVRLTLSQTKIINTISFFLFFKLKFIIVYGLLGYEPLTYEGYVYPAWANVLGWIIAGSSVAMIPAVALYQYMNTTGTPLQVITYYIFGVYNY